MASQRTGVLTVLALALLAGCKRTNEPGTAPTVDAPAVPGSVPPSAPPSATPSAASAAYPEPLPTGTTPAPTEIVVKNVTQTPQSFGDEPAPLSGFTLAEERGHYGVLAFDRAKSTCDCECTGEGRCALCGPRARRPITLAPGAESRLPWNGLLRRYGRSERGHCYDTFAPAPGTYWVAPGGKKCGAKPIALPAKAPIVIELSDAEDAPCENDPHSAERRGRIALHQMLSGAANRAPLANLDACKLNAIPVVEATALDAQPHGGACTVAIGTGKFESEVRVWLGSESYSTFFDLPGIAVTRVRFP